MLPDYSQEAHDALSKAVKLDPRLVEAWIQLGESYWKNQDVEGAKNCFVGALNHVSEQNQISGTSLYIETHEISEIIWLHTHFISASRYLPFESRKRDGTLSHVVIVVFIVIANTGHPLPQEKKTCRHFTQQ